MHGRVVGNKYNSIKIARMVMARPVLSILRGVVYGERSKKKRNRFRKIVALEHGGRCIHRLLYVLNLAFADTYAVADNFTHRDGRVGV
jgi:hypothetical protein